MSSLTFSLWLRLRYILDTLGASLDTIAASLYPLLSIKKQDLTGKIAIVTGANAGLGYAIALSLAQQGASVYLACRSRSKGEIAASRITEETGNKDVHVTELDTSSLESVRGFAKNWNQPIDILMHNAGIASTPSQDEKTSEEGLGLIYATNFAGPFLLTSLVEHQLTANARVIFTSSNGSYMGNPGNFFMNYQGRLNSQCYCDTKLMQVAFARALQNRWTSKGSTKIAQAFTPGYALTEIFGKMDDTANKKDIPWKLLKAYTTLAISAEQGAITGVYLATSQESKAKRGGQFWNRLHTRITSIDFLTQKDLDEIWQQWSKDSGAYWT